MAPKTSSPLRILPPPGGVLVAESVHAPRFQMTSEMHGFFELYFLQRGSVRYFEAARVEPVYLSEGSLYCIDRECLHRIDDQSAATLLILALSREFMEAEPQRGELWSQLRRKGHHGLRPDVPERDNIERSFRIMLAEQAAKRSGHELLINAEADRLLVTLARLPDRFEESNSYRRVAAIVRQVTENFFDELTIDEAARQAHLSRRRFSSLFREVTGESYLEYRNRLRLEYAAGLIEQGRHTIAGAAFSSGFNDLAHFYRLFGRRFGMSPGKWGSDKRDAGE